MQNIKHAKNHYKYSASSCAWEDYTLTPSNTLVILKITWKFGANQGMKAIGKRIKKNATRGDILIFSDTFCAFTWKTAS